LSLQFDGSTGNAKGLQIKTVESATADAFTAAPNATTVAASSFECFTLLVTLAKL
jgi:hypothetical protein